MRLAPRATPAHRSGVALCGPGPASAHEVEHVPELLLLRAQVLQVLLVRLDLERDAVDDGEAVALDAGPLARVVGDEPHAAYAEVAQDLRADAVVAHVGRKAELLVGLDGVEALLVLERVGADL